MAEPLFDQLRTKEQLGYSVGCGIRETSGVLGFCIYAQSAAYGPSHLYSRVRAFMESFQESLVRQTSCHGTALAEGESYYEAVLLKLAYMRVAYIT